MKYDEKIDEVKIKTADISNKFKFFETYKPESKEKRPFRMTPPRDGVVPQNNNDDEEDAERTETPPYANNMYVDVSHNAAQRSSTTTKMLSVFRQMEEDVRSNRGSQGGLKPLKSFTPPPDDGRRIIDRNSRSGSEYTDSEDGSDEDDESDNDDVNNQRPMDEALQQAQAAARAKQLRAKFEKWEQKEIKREQDRLYDGEDQSQIDTRWYVSHTQTHPAHIHSMEKYLYVVRYTGRKTDIVDAFVTNFLI